MSGDGEQAKKNMQIHITTIKNGIMNFLTIEEREEISMKRLNKINKVNL